MENPRIDLADSSDEGRSILEALRERGLHVEVRTIESLSEGTDAALLLLAGDDPGAAHVLVALRERELNVPVILLGHPEDAEVTAVRPLGADAHYSRPVAIGRLVRKVETLLSPPETHLAPVPASHESDDEGEAEVDAAATATREPTSVHDSSVDGWSSRDPTADLPDDEAGEVQPEGIFDDESSAEVSGVAEVTGVSLRDDIVSIEEALMSHDPDDPVSQVARRDSARPEAESVAILSPRLSRIFREADARVFPDSPPLDLDLLDLQESARELVPDQLLEVVSMPVEAREEDPLEAFTYVGVVPPEHVGAPLPLPEAAQRFQRQSKTGEEALPPARPARTEAAGVPGPSRPPSTSVASDRAHEARVSDRVHQASVREPTTDEGEPTRDEPTRERLEQRGSVDDLEVLRFLMTIARATTPIDVRLTLPRQAPETPETTMELTVAEGRLTRLVADVHVRALAELHRHRRVDEVPMDEARAASALDARVAAGLIGRFEADRFLRRAHEARIHDLVTAPSITFDVTRALAHRSFDPGLLGSPLSAVLAEGARRRIDASRLRQLFGGGALVLAVHEELHGAAVALGLEPEVAQVIERHDRASIDVYLSAAPADEGLAGALHALWAVDAVDVKAQEADCTVVGDPADAVRALVETAYALAEEGCYFDVLGVDPGVLPRELRAAYEARRGELVRIDLEVHGLERLSTQHREAIDVVDEAFEVLRDETLKRAYRQALGL